MTIKQNVRKKLLTKRQEMTTSEWQRKSDAICHHLQHADVLANARTILAYTSFRQEPDLMPLMVHLSRNSALPSVQAVSRGDRILGLPRCEGRHLIWHQWNPSFDLLISGAYGILEPNAHWPTINTSRLRDHDVILVPAVGCDRQGYRIGYGGGFYDRMLSKPEWTSMIKIGIVFDFAYVDALPIDPWDQPLSGICTERGLRLLTS